MTRTTMSATSRRASGIWTPLIIMTLFKHVMSVPQICPPERTTERYMKCDSLSAAYYKIICDPETVLGFKDPNSIVSWVYNEKLAGPPWPYAVSSFKYHPDRGVIESSSTSPKDAGNYTCKVTSSNGTSISTTFDLCITVSSDFEKGPVTLENQEATKIKKTMPGTEAVFFCKASIGNPRCLGPINYTINWEKVFLDGKKKPVNNSQNVQLTVNIEDIKNGGVQSELTFKHVRQEHYGAYECVVTNVHGELRINYTLERGVPKAEYLTRIYQTAIGIMMTICFFIPVVVCFCWRLRMFIALYYSEKTFDPSVADGYSYDIFVVHGETSTQWVWDILLPTLEGDYGYKCCLPSRDILGGEVIIDAISEEVSKCRRVIVVITPCLLSDKWSAWAIHHAFKAAMNTPTRILPLVLQDIKEKRNYPDPHNLMEILKILMTKRIRVPYACQLQESETMTSKTTEVKTKMMKDEEEDELSRKTHRLGLPQEKSGSLRSRSKSPKNQRVFNMINATNEISKSNFGGRGEGAGKEGEGYGKDGGLEGGAGRRISPSDIHLNFEEPVDEEPESPCSITPFIFRKNSAILKKKEGPRTFLWTSWLWKGIQVVFVGDEKQLFWQTVRLRLSPPLASKTGKNLA